MGIRTTKISDRFQAYTALQPPEHQINGQYITSMTTRFDGKIYSLPSCGTRMETVEVNTEKDNVLKKYFLHLRDVFCGLASKGTIKSPEDFLQALSAKIQKDFPYADRMKDEEYVERKYPKAKGPYMLGDLMMAHDLVCRHYGLLLCSALEYFKNEAQADPHFPIKCDEIEANYFSEIDRRKKSGHAYALVSGKHRYSPVFYVLDPANQNTNFIALHKVLLNPSGIPKNYHRYLFPLARLLGRKTDPVSGRYVDLIRSVLDGNPPPSWKLNGSAWSEASVEAPDHYDNFDNVRKASCRMKTSTAIAILAAVLATAGAATKIVGCATSDQPLSHLQK